MTGYFLQAAVQYATPLLFASLGGILNEKAGNLNLGIEGMMLLGAAAGFAAGMETGNPVFALLLAGAAGCAGALCYAVVTVTLLGNQTVTGLALTVLGGGFASMIGKPYGGQGLPESVTSALGTQALGPLASVPLIGPALFYQSPLVPLSLLCAALLFFYLRCTRPGLRLRLTGENPAAAEASGAEVSKVKYIHILSGGFLCGIGGAYLSLVFLPRWQENMTSGMGWIAVALIIFASWRPERAVLGAYLFGILRGLAFKMQNIPVFGFTIPSQLLDMLPYLVTILALALSSLTRRGSKAPAYLGKAYFRENRE